MRKHNPLIIGTLILTITGFTSRIIGFFYRIFLSQSFGEEGMGIYQLIAPSLALSFSFCAAGIQTAISKYTASETTNHDYKTSLRILLVGVSISLLLSAFFGFFLYRYADFLASETLLEARCAPLLRIIALSIPFGSIHSCINGYFYGIRQTKIPALTQIVEQVVRVVSVYVIFQILSSKNLTANIGFAVIGLLIGEIVSMLISVVAVYRRFAICIFHSYKPRLEHLSSPSLLHWGRKITLLAVPLSANKIILNLLQSVEAIYIPNRLQLFGLSTTQALSTYGVLTGMALPLILFPSAITNSISVLLLPLISEAESNQNFPAIKRAILKSIRYCFLLGLISCLIFFFFGNFMGTFLFHSPAAGNFILTLSFICPFLYTATTLSSILNGLGKTALTFLFHMISLGIRLFFVFFFIPLVGIKGYLWGLLLSQLVLTLLILLALKKYMYYNK